MNVKIRPVFYCLTLLLFSLFTVSCENLVSKDVNSSMEHQSQFCDSIFIDPVGVYFYDSIQNKNKFYSGSIVIMSLDSCYYSVDFKICKGPPSYNIGTFQEVLSYKDNCFHYACEYDNTSRITLQVSDSGINIDHLADNYNWSCGFGHAVVAHGLFVKDLVWSKSLASKFDSV